MQLGKNFFPLQKEIGWLEFRLGCSPYPNPLPKGEGLNLPLLLGEDKGEGKKLITGIFDEKMHNTR